MAKGGGGGGDVKGAAREAGEQSRWLAREQTIANRPNQYNAWGSNEWVRTPYQPYDSGGFDMGSGGPTRADGMTANAPAVGGRVPGATAGASAQPTLTGEQAKAQQDRIARLRRQAASGRGVSRQQAIEELEKLEASGGAGPVDGVLAEGGPPLEQWTQVERLNPILQSSLDAQMRTQRGRSQLAEYKMGDVREQMRNPMDWDQFGDVVGFDPAEQRQAAEDAAYGRATSRLDPQFQQRQQDLQISLRNRGLKEGDAAYDAAMQNFDRARNDAYEQARMGATAEGRQETGLGLQTNERANALRSQQIAEALQQRGMSLQEVNALLQGQEIEGGTPASDSKATIADILSGFFG